MKLEIIRQQGGPHLLRVWRDQSAVACDHMHGRQQRWIMAGILSSKCSMRRRMSLSRPLNPRPNVLPPISLNYFKLTLRKYDKGNG